MKIHALLSHTLKPLLASMAFVSLSLCASLGFAEPTLLYEYQSYEREQTVHWAIIPVLHDNLTLPSKTEAMQNALFQTLRTRKLASYGKSTLAKNRVDIDPERCEYAPIITAEIDANFAFYALPPVKYYCQKKAVEPQEDLTHFLAIHPLHRAMQKQTPPLGWVQLPQGLVPVQELHKRLQNNDRETLRAIDAILRGPQRRAKAAIIMAYPAWDLPETHEKITPFLTDKDPVLVRAAVQALRHTADPAVLTQVEQALERDEDPYQRVANTLIQDAGTGLQAYVLLREVKSDEHPRVMKALNLLQTPAMLRVLTDAYESLFALKSENFQSLTQLLLRQRLDAQLAAHLPTQNNNNALYLARQLRAKSPEHTGALRYLVSHAPEHEAHDALRVLAAASHSDARPLIAHGLRHPVRSIRRAAEGLLNTQLLPKERARAIEALYAQGVTPQLGWDAMVSLAMDSAAATPSLKALRAEPELYKRRALAVRYAHALSEQGREWLAAQKEWRGSVLMSFLTTKTHADAAQKLVQTMLYDADGATRLDLAYALGASHDTPLASWEVLINDSNTRVADQALAALSRVKPEKSDDFLLTRLRTATPELRAAILEVLPAWLHKDNAEKILAAISNELFDPDHRVKFAAMAALADIVHHAPMAQVQENALMSLALTAKDPDKAIALGTFVHLLRSQNAQAFSVVLEGLSSPDSFSLAAQAMRAYAPQSMLPHLKAWLSAIKEPALKKEGDALYDYLQRYAAP